MAQTAPITCPPGALLERSVIDETITHFCLRDGGLEGPLLVTRPDGGAVKAGRYRNQQKHGQWLEPGVDGGLQRLEYVDGREAPVRPCPPGTLEASTCVARCCDIIARWCVATDGGLVGPWDEWTIEGRRVRSNLDDPLPLAPFRDLGSVRRQSLELIGDAPR